MSDIAVPVLAVMIRQEAPNAFTRLNRPSIGALNQREAPIVHITAIYPTINVGQNTHPGKGIWL